MNIRDPIFSDIPVDETAKAMIEDPRMQRLRNVRQLAFAHLVYPGANQTRFEHSVGTYHVTRMLMRSIGEDAAELPYIGLLHDVGHAAFSHVSDDALSKYLHKTHEALGLDLIMGSKIRDIISDSAMSMSRFKRYFSGHELGAIITGALGSDRIDYLLRDAYHTGVGYGIVDYNRIVNTLALYKSVPALREQGLSAAESLLISRYLMFTSVYYHHAAVIAGSMFKKALDHAIEDGDVDPKQLVVLNDSQVMDALLRSRRSGELARRLMGRVLFKRVYNGRQPAIGDVELRDALERAGLGPDDYVIERFSFRSNDYEISVLDRHGRRLGGISELSPVISALGSAFESRSRLIVACDARHRARATDALGKLLNRQNNK